LRYPEDAREAEVQGKVFIRFVITPEGHLTNVEVLRGVNGMPSLAKEAVRVVKLTDGNWTPGKQNGKPVPVQFNLPVNFVLQ
jgi:protein TonB